MSLRTLTDYYTNLLSYAYRSQPKAQQQIQLWSKQALGDFLAADLSTCFVLDTAVGAQLDILGKYIGVARNIGTGTPHSYFGLWDYASTLGPALYKGTWDPASDSPTLPAAAGGNNGWWYAIQVPGTSTSPIAETFAAGDVIVSNGSVWAKSTLDNANGLTDYTNLATNALAEMYSYSTAGTNVADLSDSDYRQVLKFQVIRNASDHTLASIMAALHEVFPGLIQLVDNTDMTMSYLVSVAFPLSPTLLEQFLPRPMGVGITVTIITPSGGGGALLTEGGDFLTTEDGDHLVLG